MTTTVKTHWKLLLELTDDALRTLPTLFNERTGRTFIRTFGSRSDLTFSPTSLTCATRFYDLLNQTSEEIGFFGRKFPLTHLESQSTFNFSFRLYGKSLLIVEVQRHFIPFDKDTDLLKLNSIWNNTSLSKLTLRVLGLINNPKKNYETATNKPPVYHYNFIVGPSDDLPSTGKLVELLTRHKSPSNSVIKAVRLKNKLLQSDTSTLFIDRQGVVASIPSEMANEHTVRRRFLAASNMHETMSCIKKMIEKKTVQTLESSALIDLSFYFKQPEKRFAHSTSSKHIWNLLAAEFGLTSEAWKESDMDPFIKNIRYPTILIVTALVGEAAPIIAKLSEPVGEEINSVYVTSGRLKSGINEARVHVISIGVGNTKAALNTRHLLNLLHPNLTIFSGIAAGRKEATVGSVVVANMVYFYESGREEKKGFLPRPRTVQLSPKADSLANAFLGNEMNAKRPFNVYFKPIACGEKLLADTKGVSATRVDEIYSDALAIEMEGFGYLNAFIGTDLMGILVRGISDRMDKKEEQENPSLAIENATDITIKLINFYISSKLIKQQST